MNFPRFTNFINEGIVHTRSEGRTRGRAGSAASRWRGPGRLRPRGDQGHILPEGGNQRCFPLLRCNKKLRCIWKFCERKHCSLVFFSILNSGEGKRHAVGCLWGQLCWRAPIHAIPDLFWMKEKQIRDPESHRSVAPSSCPSSEGGSPQHPLASVGAALKRAWVGTSSQASGQADGFFQGLYDIPEASTCPSISRAQGQPMDDRINWFSSK